MERKAVAMVSGGLDSSLAVRILRNQGIEIFGFHVRNPFECCKGMVARESTDLGIQVTAVSIAEDYFEMLKNPRYNYGRGANPCTDCRIYVARLAKTFMEHVGASFVISGEVIGQRPNSQMRDSLRAIEKQSGLEGLLLRPLSAKLMKPTIPELEVIVDRSLLYDF
jgi:tRNA U34 2-thiouridine synthase MnmA/TrmU